MKSSAVLFKMEEKKKLADDAGRKSLCGPPPTTFVAEKSGLILVKAMCPLRQ